VAATNGRGDRFGCCFLVVFIDVFLGCAHLADEEELSVCC
jgi:hypothetical protein